MTEKEKILEELKKQLLIEMAITRSDFKDYITNNCPIAKQHLILVLTQPANPNSNHWKGEIYGNFSRFKKLKYSNKYPTKEDFLDCGMETQFEIIEDQIDYDIIEIYSKELDKVIFKVSEIGKQISPEKIKKYIKEYFEWAIENINHSTGVIDKQSAYQKIDDLIKQYNKE